MRNRFLAVGLIIAGLLAVVFLVVDQEVPPPPVAPSVEQVCVETMDRSTPDLSWVVEGREEKIGGRDIETVTLGELPSHNGKLVRVAGVLHAEFEWVGLYPSRAWVQDQPWRAPWVSLGSLWPDEPYWHTGGPSVSDRCVLVEGTYSGDEGGHFGMFNGTIGDVLRLDVWSTPHRPFVTTPPPPPPAKADSACSEKPTTPELSDAGAGQEMLAAFTRLYATGEFQLGYCLADVRVNETGTVDTVRVRRPRNVDKRVESAIVRSMKSRRYRPATACGRSVPFTMSVGVGHCPSQAERDRKRDE